MRLVAIVVLMALAYVQQGADPIAATTLEHERESLRGLPGVRVVIEYLSPEAKADGLSEDSIRSAVELILRSSGIHIFEVGRLPYLYVRVTTFKVQASSFHAAAMQVELRQWLSQPEWSGYAATWQEMIVGNQNMRAVISHIEQMVKQFANDFLVANPK